MIFSGNWSGLKLLDELVTMTGSAYGVWYESARRSDAALEAEYGERGPSRSSSVNDPRSIEPYASSVDTCRKVSTPERRAASHNTFVPPQCVRTNSSGDWVERSTWLPAAK